MKKMTKEVSDKSTIREDEYHAVAANAMEWFKRWKMAQPINYFKIREVIASNAIEGNRLAEIMNGTLDKLEKGKPVSDRYLLGLCWFLRVMSKNE